MRPTIRGRRFKSEFVFFHSNRKYSSSLGKETLLELTSLEKIPSYIIRKIRLAMTAKMYKQCASRAKGGTRETNTNHYLGTVFNNVSFPSPL